MRRALVIALLLGLTGTAAADGTTSPVQPGSAPSKKQRYLEVKDTATAPDKAALTAWNRQLDRRIGKPPEAVISVVNGWTHEILVVPEKQGKGELPPRAMLDRFLRCRFTNKVAEMDPRLLPTVIAAARHFKSRRAVIVSAFRSPKYNLMLRKKGREVSRDSQHTYGKAIDFRLDRVNARDIDAWARSLAMGGVGFYGDSAFVHVDTDRIRYWNGE